ncbi:MAG: hypothetical protein Q7S80_02645 [bacterium]|nr:hypothetical protein [bacterium]
MVIIVSWILIAVWVLFLAFVIGFNKGLVVGEKRGKFYASLQMEIEKAQKAINDACIRHFHFPD